MEHWLEILIISKMDSGLWVIMFHINQVSIIEKKNELYQYKKK